MKLPTKKIESAILLSLITVFTLCNAKAQLSEESFKTPPLEFHPKIFMMVMSGNMSKEGITKDFESMANVGLSGLLIFDVMKSIPYGKIKYASEEHIDILKYAAKEAERLGLSFGVVNGAGWSSSGGPWVKPEQAMQMVVYSSIITKGGKNLVVEIPEFTKREGYNKKLFTIAYPSLKAELADAEPVKITSSDPALDIKLVTDKKWDALTTLKKTTQENPWIQFEYPKNHPISSATIHSMTRTADVELFGSNDGINFTSIKTLDKIRIVTHEWTSYNHFDQQNYKYYRLTSTEDIILSEVKISAIYTIDDVFAKTSMSRIESQNFNSVGKPDADMIIDKTKIINISKYVDEDGNFKGDLPQGSWTIMQFGTTPTGAINIPAGEGGEGLEVDKLSKEAFKNHYHHFVEKLVNAAKPVAPNAFQYSEIDSYEMGGENWTPKLDSIFKKRFGYGLVEFLPLYAGKFVESATTTEAVLQDMRSLVSDLMTENYYAYFTELCHQDGLKTYIENYGFGGPLNQIEVGGKADMPTAEFWMNKPIRPWQVEAPIASAHTYGKNLISAEAFTSTSEINWSGTPANAKLYGDKAWTLGINEFMYHRFAHQANTHVTPGMSMDRWGFNMDRNQTWWYNGAKAWFEYVSRGSYLLRQGVPVADLLVFVGDDSPNSTILKTEFNPSIPIGINFDNVNSEVLINRISVKDGKLVLPDGTTYQALVLKNNKYLKLITLKRIAKLSQLGATIIGDKPFALLGYGHSKADEFEFKKLVAEIWANKNTFLGYNWETILPKTTVKKDFVVEGRTDISFAHRKNGNEEIYFSYNPDSVAHVFKIKINVSGKQPEIWNSMNGSITKIAQYNEQAGFTDLSLKLMPKESFFIIFKPETTASEAVKPNENYSELSFSKTKENVIKASVTKNGKYSVVLNSDKTWHFELKDLLAPLPLIGSWEVVFNKEQGYGGKVEFKHLIDWKDYPKDSIKYYSGTATYFKSFIIPQTFIKTNNSYMLDLGNLSIVAEVNINGNNLGVLWMPPFKVDVSKYLKVGENKLEIKITNLWTNRLIGDERYPKQDGGYELQTDDARHPIPAWYSNNEQMPAGPRTTFNTTSFYKKGDTLVSSGLLGPVKITPSAIFYYER